MRLVRPAIVQDIDYNSFSSLQNGHVKASILKLLRILQQNDAQEVMNYLPSNIPCHQRDAESLHEDDDE